MAWINISEVLYPVGTIYETTSSTSPSELFGGTWSLIDDVFLLGAGNAYTVKQTGGEATHTLTKNEMPSHTHDWRGILGDSTCTSGSYTVALFGSDYATSLINSGKGPQSAGGGHPIIICRPIIQFISGKGRHE